MMLKRLMVVILVLTMVGCASGASGSGDSPLLDPGDAGFVLHTCLDAIAEVSRAEDLDHAKALALQGLEHAGTDPELRRLADTTLSYVVLMRDGLSGLKRHLGDVGSAPLGLGDVQGQGGREARVDGVPVETASQVLDAGAASAVVRFEARPGADCGASGSDPSDAQGAPVAGASAAAPPPARRQVRDPVGYPIYVDL